MAIVAKPGKIFKFIISAILIKDFYEDDNLTSYKLKQYGYFHLRDKAHIPLGQPAQKKKESFSTTFVTFQPFLPFIQDNET